MLRHFFPNSFLLFLVVNISLAIPSGHAQTSIATTAGATVEILRNRINEVEASTDLDETSKSSLLELYRKSISFIEQHKTYDAAIKEFTNSRESAPEESDKLRKELEKIESKPVQVEPGILEKAPLPDLEQQLLSKKAAQTALEAQLAELEDLIEAQTQRSVKARERLTQAISRQPEISEAQQVPTPEGQSQRMTEALQWVLELEKKALSTEIEMLNQELLSQPMRVELLGVQRDKVALELSRQQEQVDFFESEVVDRRRVEAEVATEEAEATERRTIGKHPLVHELAQKNRLLGEELKKMAATLEDITSEENSTAEQAKHFAENFRLARQKLDIAGLSEALGQVLVEQRRSLPDSRDFAAAEKQRQQLLVESSLRQIRNQQERTRLRNIKAYVNDLMIGVQVEEKPVIRKEVLELAETRRELIDKAIAADDTYLQSMEELDLAQRQLYDTVTSYNAFLDERLLWIRSGEPPSWQSLKSISNSVAIFFSVKHWLSVVQALVVPGASTWVLLLGVAAFIVLLVKRTDLIESLQQSSRRIGQLRHDKFSSTIKALALTLLLALTWPVLFTALGLHLQFEQLPELTGQEVSPSSQTESVSLFVIAVGKAFYDIALYAFYFSAFTIFCAPYGLALNHFGWSQSLTEKLRSRIIHLIAVFFPTVFLLSASIQYDPAAMASGMSRLLFFIVLVAMAWFFVRIFAPRHGVLSDYYKTNPSSPLSWFRFVWLALGLTVPLILAGLAVAGYVYTAGQLGERLIDTLWLIVVIILIHQLVVRWILLTERRLAFNAAIEKHRVKRAAMEALEDKDEALSGDSSSVPVEEPEIDYEALSEDTNKLIKTALTVLTALGLWAIWSDILPALRILDEVALWSYSSTVDGTEKLLPVTLGDVILGLLIIIIGTAAARRLPALIEIVLLARLNITAGGRYAITTLTQYTIVAVGIVLIFNILGGSWSEIQWLIAALGVGIGFGLQEIVANFISGLILLFERPIRIGDVVTVGDTDGVVTRIRIRSTTIRDRDEKELVVPNKEFITGRLLNWTLSDQITRIVIPVGIAYGSDIPLALKLVQEAAQEHDRILEDPKPLVTFESFGDNALVIILRCFIGIMDMRLQTTSELNQAIYHKFDKAGIIISFPQRDIHLDTTRPLDIRVHRLSENSDRLPA